MRLAPADPDAAIGILERARCEAPRESAVLHALCLVLARAGEERRAVALAREAVPICFREREGMMAAEILDAVSADVHALGFTREELMAIGGALTDTSRWPVAFNALAGLLMKDPSDGKVVEMLLALADRCAARVAGADDARRVCRFLEVVAGDGPLGDRIAQRLRRLSEAGDTQPLGPG